MDVKVTVYPEPGMFPVVARGLLAAADHPSQVVSVSHPRAGFQVPQEVFDRFEAQAPSTDEGVPDLQAPVTEARKRRPGRSRKNLLTPEELEAAIAAGTPDPGKEE
jgi:hypothetical protein